MQFQYYFEFNFYNHYNTKLACSKILSFCYIWLVIERKWHTKWEILSTAIYLTRSYVKTSKIQLNAMHSLKFKQQQKLNETKKKKTGIFYHIPEILQTRLSCSFPIRKYWKRNIFCSSLSLIGLPFTYFNIPS